MSFRPGTALAGLRPGRSIPFGLPEVFLALTVLIVEFVLSSEPFTAGSTLCGLAGVLLVCAGVRWPQTAAVLSVPFTAVCSYTAGDASTYAIFFIAILVEVVTAGGLPVIGVILVLVQTVGSAVDFSARSVVLDPVVLLVIFAILGTGFLIGRNRLTQVLRQAALRRSLADSQRLQRLGLARELHDSVATSLTGVVMRSQALELTMPEDGDPAVVDGLRDISRTSRAALEQLRTMLRLLNSETYPGGTDDPAPAPTLHESLTTSSQELRAHGLKVRTRTSLPRGAEPAVDRRALSRILTEMTANAAKHSPERSEVTLSCRVEEGASVTVSMTNPVAGSRPDDPAMTSHLGLGSMAARAQAAGGTLEAAPVAQAPDDPRPQLWRTAVTLPIVESVE